MIKWRFVQPQEANHADLQHLLQAVVQELSEEVQGGHEDY